MSYMKKKPTKIKPKRKPKRKKITKVSTYSLNY